MVGAQSGCADIGSKHWFLKYKFTEYESSKVLFRFIGFKPTCTTELFMYDELNSKATKYAKSGNKMRKINRKFCAKINDKTTINVYMKLRWKGLKETNISKINIIFYFWNCLVRWIFVTFAISNNCQVQFSASFFIFIYLLFLEGGGGEKEVPWIIRFYTGCSLSIVTSDE